MTRGQNSKMAKTMENIADKIRSDPEFASEVIALYNGGRPNKRGREEMESLCGRVVELEKKLRVAETERNHLDQYVHKLEKEYRLTADRLKSRTTVTRHIAVQNRDNLARAIPRGTPHAPRSCAHSTSPIIDLSGDDHTPVRPDPHSYRERMKRAGVTLREGVVYM